MTVTSRARNEAQVGTVIDDRAKALRAKNAAGVVRHHAPDFVQFSLAPPLISKAADVNGLEAWFATWRGSLGSARLAARHMIKRRAGVTLTITSTPARMGVPLVGGLVPAWGAIEALTRALSAELGPQGIRAVCLRPHRSGGI